MKLSIKLFYALAILFFAQASYAVNTAPTQLFGQESATVDDFLSLKFSDAKASASSKLTFKDRLAFIATKKYLKTKIKNGSISAEDDLYESAAGFNFKFGPFIAGFFLGILGLLLVWILVPKPRKNAMVSCLIGMLIWGVLFGAILFR